MNLNKKKHTDWDCKKLSIDNWKDELSKVSNNLKELKRKYAHKRTGIRNLFSCLIKDKFNKTIPTKYPSGKRHPLILYIDIIQTRAYIMGFRKAIEQCELNQEKIK